MSYLINNSSVPSISPTSTSIFPTSITSLVPGVTPPGGFPKVGCEVRLDPAYAVWKVNPALSPPGTVYITVDETKNTTITSKTCTQSILDADWSAGISRTAWFGGQYGADFDSNCNWLGKYIDSSGRNSSVATAIYPGPSTVCDLGDQLGISFTLSSDATSTRGIYWGSSIQGEILYTDFFTSEYRTYTLRDGSTYSQVNFIMPSLANYFPDWSDVIKTCTSVWFNTSPNTLTAANFLTSVTTIRAAEGAATPPAAPPTLVPGAPQLPPPTPEPTPRPAAPTPADPSPSPAPWNPQPQMPGGTEPITRPTMEATNGGGLIPAVPSARPAQSQGNNVGGNIISLINSGAKPTAGTGGQAESNAGSNAGSNTGFNSGSNPGSNAGSNVNPNPASNSGSNIGSNAGTGAGTGSSGSNPGSNPERPPNAPLIPAPSTPASTTLPALIITASGQTATIAPGAAPVTIGGQVISIPAPSAASPSSEPVVVIGSKTVALAEALSPTGAVREMVQGAEVRATSFVVAMPTGAPGSGSAAGGRAGSGTGTGVGSVGTGAAGSLQEGVPGTGVISGQAGSGDAGGQAQASYTLTLAPGLVVTVPVATPTVGVGGYVNAGLGGQAGSGSGGVSTQGAGVGQNGGRSRNGTVVPFTGAATRVGGVLSLLGSVMAVGSGVLAVLL
ncbi:hypothetical protein KVT40_001747 [Elsinoe batatas]|uniref:Uncharacterized protein n=1 Tax=Elsinoe batatas TaxID=2601811 RepID=A0A8K0LDB5_9PEZI|nr:hypothetical protein KVT40_001747 [Elsinoe batatas]